MGKFYSGPEHQCGGPQEACCIPGCPECRQAADYLADNLNADEARLVAFRCFAGWDAAMARIAELEKECFDRRYDPNLVKQVRRLRQAIGDQARWLASIRATGRYTGADSAQQALEHALGEVETDNDGGE